MRASKQDLLVTDEGEGFVSRQTEWGDMNVAWETFPQVLMLHPSSRGCQMIGASARIGDTS